MPSCGRARALQALSLQPAAQHAHRQVLHESQQDERSPYLSKHGWVELFTLEPVFATPAQDTLDLRVHDTSIEP